MSTLVATPTFTVGPRSTPQEVRDFRQNILDFHKNEGYPVIHKHRWNEKDLREGLVEQCPLHDDLYDSDLSWDPICFGTGYVGGWAPGEIIYVSLADSPVDVIKRTKEGILMMEDHHQLTTTWFPELGDGDLIILADFVPGGWQIDNLHDRYVLQEVEPVVMRGPGFSRSSRNALGRPLRVGQKSNVDKLPYGHRFYDVPIVFDPADVPPDVWPPGPEQPDPDVEGGTYTAFSVGVRVVGKSRGLQQSDERIVKLAVAGANTEASANVRISGEDVGTIIHLT